ncbi:hypothetical protein MNB_SV-15-121 [hydrothermal vent metagenome]|uniref:Uncharacterized protein n=1 Tax=hydrothermal vent metagenome TaxID=652676 RepID=A0A1W1EIH8_9ZZZZ
MNELERIEALEREIKKLKGLNTQGIPTFSFSKIRDKELKEFLSIKKAISYDIFDSWFNNNVKIDKEIEEFLIELIDENRLFIDSYNEEDLKVHFIIPLLNKIRFKSIEHNIRDFYENKIVYKTDRFIFGGTTDFVVAKGLFETEKPYFFIQEFKKAEDFSNPRPQLLAELISAVELNNETSMRGAYIIGAIWNFVILEKLGKDKYQYFVSENFDSSKIDDLKGIYRNLMFVKEEIIEMIKNDKETDAKRKSTK